jgi:hypothetical protein
LAFEEVTLITTHKFKEETMLYGGRRAIMARRGPFILFKVIQDSTVNKTSKRLREEMSLGKKLLRLVNELDLHFNA